MLCLEMSSRERRVRHLVQHERLFPKSGCGVLRHGNTLEFSGSRAEAFSMLMS
jgi:hypothetical protein